MSRADKIRHVLRNLPGRPHPNDTPLITLAGMGGADDLAILIADGDDVNTPRPDGSGVTAIGK